MIVHIGVMNACPTLLHDRELEVKVRPLLLRLPKLRGSGHAHARGGGDQGAQSDEVEVKGEGR